MKSKVPHLLYITLLAVFFLITGSSFFISCGHWNNIVVGIGSGGIASVIVAWIIDYRNNKKQKIESKAKYETIILQFVDIYKRLLWVTANECNINTEDEEWSFYDWLQFLKDIASNCPKDEQRSINTRCSRISSNIVLLQEQIKAFQLQSATLIFEDFPNEKNIKNFFKFKMHTALVL